MIFDLKINEWTDNTMRKCTLMARNTFINNFKKVERTHKKFASTSAASSLISEVALCEGDKASKSLLFRQEKARQLRNLPTIHKIEVQIDAPPHSDTPYTLAMNSGLSTPYDCGRHLNESVLKFGALATLDGKVWDMHRPIRPLSNEKSLETAAGYNRVKLHFLYFTDQQPWPVHSAYWRSCSFVLGAILESCFKEEFKVTLHSWPGTNYRTGSFVYDCQIQGLNDWTPTQEELNIMSRTAIGELKEGKHNFEPLDVDISIAEKIFQDNPLKLEQLEFIAKNSTPKDRVRLYRLGDFVDISKGPMISNSAQIGNFAVTKFVPFETREWGKLYRVQGVSLPFTQRVNSWTWEVLTKSGKTENSMPLPSKERWNQFEG